MTSDVEFDYVVVGAGSAGCVVAARLSESGAYRVALLEAGGEDDSFWIHLPIGYSRLYDSPEYNWLLESEPEPGLAGGRSFQPCGKVLGGSGSINGNVYQRGLPTDFDHWAHLGNTGWGSEDVRPFFEKAEQGPLSVSDLPRDELSDAFVAGAAEAGYRRNDGFNNEHPEGFGYNQATLRRGRRFSTADAYLHPARRRQNLTVIVAALATRIVFEDSEARGVEFTTHGTARRVLARREVILCAGTFHSPQLLQVSGVGPSDLLQQCGVQVVAHCPGVGTSLQDHIGVGMTYRCSRPVTINDVVNNPLRGLAAVLQYALFRRGPLTSSPVAAAGLVRTDPASAEPDIKLQLRTWNRSHSGRKKERMGLAPFSSFGVAVHLMHPESRGTIRIRSKDIATPPEIRFNYFQSERDHRAALLGMRTTRRIMTMPSIAAYVVEELTPGSQCDADADLVDHFRRRAISGHHATGSCPMGVGKMAAVDPRLRVRGVRRLRVIDAAIMPRQVAANTNATTIMIGEKGAAMVLEDAKETPQ